MRAKICRCCGKKLNFTYFRCKKCGTMVCGACMMKTRALKCVHCGEGVYSREKA